MTTDHQSVMRRSIAIPIRKGFAAVLVAALVSMQAVPALAAQVPNPLSSLFLQTSGPNAGITIGDYYTSPAGGNTDHLFILRVPGNWPAGVNVTVALYDPELALPNPVSPTAADEVRGTADNATFTLRDPSGSTIATQTYSDASSNGLWVELATFDPGVTGTGTYELHVTVSDNDDNSFRIDASHDPDCAVGGPGSCPSASLVSGNESDKAPGGSGKLGLGVVRTSYQHAGIGLVCQDHVFYVNSSTPRPLRAHNFDMDNSGSVTYTTPAGGTVAGTASGNGKWNNSVDATRVGDVLPDINGWWTATICISSTNQYVFEAPSAGPSFPEPQPTPNLIISKNDGVSTAMVGDDLTYSITVSNVSDLDPSPGEAFGVVVSDPLPSGTSFVGCSAPADVICIEAGGIVTATALSALDPGDSIAIDITLTVAASVDPMLVNTATLDYQDGLGNAYEPATASDSDDVDFEPVLALAVSGPGQMLRGDSAAMVFSLSHDASSDQSSVDALSLACAVCASTTYVGGDTNSDGRLDEGETWIWDAVVNSGAGDPDPLVVTGDATGLDRNGNTVADSATHGIDLIEPATLSGSVFEDLNGNGARDAGEPGIGGSEVTLSDGSTSVVVVSVADGSYQFIDLAPGAYSLVVDEATVSGSRVATGPVSVAASLAEGENSTSNDFGFAETVTISGQVFTDDDLDGSLDGGEAGLGGVTVTLSSGSTSTSVTTLADGSYSFSALPGSFTVVLGDGVPTGWTLTTPSSLPIGLVLSGEVSSGNDFGAAPPVVADDADDPDPESPAPQPEVESSESLPFTGFDTGRVAVAGALLLLVGGLVVALGGAATDET